MPHNERSGLLYALAGFALLSVGDATIKSMAGLWPGSALAALRYTAGAAGLSALLYAREGAGAFRFPRPRFQLLRGLAIACSTAAFFFALALMPLASATAIGFTSPMFTALFAAPLLGEPARRSTWIASVVAFAGVLIVLRPNLAAIGWPALLPLFAAAGMALVMIGNRAVAGRASGLAMQASIALIAAPTLLALTTLGHLSGVPAFEVPWPRPSVIARCLAIACSASTAHWLIYMATTRAGAATIAPMTYVQLLMATGIGWAVFHEAPDGVALLGAAVIVGSGLWLWHDGRMREPALTD